MASLESIRFLSFEIELLTRGMSRIRARRVLRAVSSGSRMRTVQSLIGGEFCAGATTIPDVNPALEFEVFERWRWL